MPHSWRTLGLLAAAWIVLAMIAAVLVRDHLAKRPIDLVARTEKAADQTEEFLRELGVPASRILRLNEGIRDSDEARWYFCRFEVDLPAGSQSKPLEKALAEGLAREDVGVLPDGGDGVLELMLAGQRFAELQLRVAPERAAVAAPAQAAPSPSPAPAVVEPSALPQTESALAVEPPVVPEPEPEPEPKPEAVSQEPPKETKVAAATVPSLPIPTAPVAPPTSVAPGTRPRVAIIVDDGGYGGAATDAVLALDPRLTLAILPHTPQAAETARMAIARGFEVILHMPMEGAGANGEALKPLRVHMSPDEIAAATEAALEQVPGATGINNHEGSRFTGNTEAMKAFLGVVRQRSLFFVDSLTSPLSVAGDVARSLGIRTAVRDVFLDNESNAAYIRGQFAQLLDEARKKGAAVGICHFRPATVEVLPELLAQLPAAGIDLVHVSELAQ